MSTGPYTPPPEARGMSGTSKVLIGLGIGCGVMVLVCCGGFLGLGYYAGHYFAKNTSNDPSTIRAVTREITAIDIPEPMAPEMSMNAPLVGKTMAWVVYVDKPSESSLMLMSSEWFDKADRGTMRAQLDEQFRRSSKQGQEVLRIEEVTPYDIVVNGKPGEFSIARGVGHDTKREFWEVSGVFQGLKGTTMLLMRLNGKVFSRDQVKAIIDSLQGTGAIPAKPARDNERKAAEG